MKKETLEKEYYKNKLTQEEIARKYGITRMTVMSYFKKYNLSPLKPYERNESQELNEDQHNLIIGTMLGDGCLQMARASKNAWLTIKHSMAQKDYVSWKYDILRDFAGCELKYSSENYKNKVYEKCYFRTICHPIFTEYMEMFYDHGIKVVTNEIAEMLNPMVISAWYMDDGYTDGTHMVFCTNSYTEPELHRLQKVLSDKFGLVTSLWLTGYTKGNNQKQYKIAILKRSVASMVSIVKPYIIPSMMYKIEPLLSGASETKCEAPLCG
jgi:hypothetical protein